jgi:hypothetical protein
MALNALVAVAGLIFALIFGIETKYPRLYIPVKNEIFELKRRLQSQADGQIEVLASVSQWIKIANRLTAKLQTISE